MRPQLLTDLITMVGIYASVQSCTVSCLHITCCLALTYAACSQHCLRLFKSMMSVKCTTILLPQLSSWTCATQCLISQIFLANRLHVFVAGAPTPLQKHSFWCSRFIQKRGQQELPKVARNQAAVGDVCTVDSLLQGTKQCCSQAVFA